MVLIAPLVGAAVFLSGLTAALPTNSYDSSSNNNYGGSSDNSNNYGGSSDNSNYGGSSNNNYGGSSNNYGGNSNNNYGGNSNNYGGNSGNNYGGNNYDSSSTSTYESTSTTMMMDSTTMMMDSSSTSMIESTSTTTSQNYMTTSYGSGSNYWGGSGYEDCVNQCIAQFGGSSGGGSYQATATSGYEGSKGTGATHTVIVAPTKGVFRMMPFATNASVGDTIEFHWGADQHTVTKSSALLPCNKSSEAPVFASGEQNKSFVFTQVVNDTNPTFYYCGTPTHCEKGMFGIINPAMAAPGSPTSLGGMMQSMAANDSDLSAYAAYSSNVTSSNDAAAKWGANFDMSNMPEWSHSLMATNVLFTRAVLGMNSEILKGDGSTDLSSVANTPLMLPMDISQPLNAASAPQAASSDAAVANAAATDANATPAAAAATDSAASAAQTSSKPNGASSVASPRLLVAGVVVLATIFAL